MCCDFLKQQLDASNCLGISIFADTHSLIELKRIADEYTKEHFEDIIKSDKFCRLLTTPQQLIDLISSDELNVRTEGRVFNAAMAWIHHDVEKRRTFMLMVCCNSLHCLFISDTQTCSIAFMQSEILVWHCQRR